MQVKRTTDALPTATTERPAIHDRDHLYGKAPSVVMLVPVPLTGAELLACMVAYYPTALTIGDLMDMSDDDVRAHVGWALATFGLPKLQQRADEREAQSASYDEKTLMFMELSARRLRAAFGVAVPMRFGRRARCAQPQRAGIKADVVAVA